jgi:hypothetical protein
MAHMALPTTPGDKINFISGTATITVIDGIAELAARSPLRCWPVPATDRVWLQWTGSGPCDLRVCDLQGRVLLAQVATGPTAEVDLHKLKPGSYTVVLTARDGGWMQAAQVVKR